MAGLVVIAVRAEPCSACPYRRDSPTGLWSPSDYLKLPRYDAETWDQPTAAFRCHATVDHLCHGWAVVGGWDLLALRIFAAAGRLEIPAPTVPLFATHSEAAAHGLSGVDDPPPEAIETAKRLFRKYPRLARYGRHGLRP